MQRTQALSTSQQQVASGKVSTDYAGIGDKTARARSRARQRRARRRLSDPARTAALNQVDLQDTAAHAARQISPAAAPGDHQMPSATATPPA